MAEQIRTRGKAIFGTLDRGASEALLARNHVAHMAFLVEGQPDIVPISYVYADGWVFGRTAPGAKSTALKHNPWVALEVDEIRSATDWQSVVLHGTMYFATPDLGGSEKKAYEIALRHLRQLDPDVLETDDVAPDRREIFRLKVERITGRTASSAPPHD